MNLTRTVSMQKLDISGLVQNRNKKADIQSTLLKSGHKGKKILRWRQRPKGFILILALNGRPLRRSSQERLVLEEAENVLGKCTL